MKKCLPEAQTMLNIIWAPLCVENDRVGSVSVVGDVVVGGNEWRCCDERSGAIKI
jgi:hypothetical protein